MKARRGRLPRDGRAAMLSIVAGAPQRWPIIGRRAELQVFEQVLGAGEQKGLVIYGRAGVGKTRLADECRQQAASAGHPAERIVGSRTAALLPLGPVAALLLRGSARPDPEGTPGIVALFEAHSFFSSRANGGPEFSGVERIA